MATIPRYRPAQEEEVEVILHGVPESDTPLGAGQGQDIAPLQGGDPAAILHAGRPDVAAAGVGAPALSPDAAKASPHVDDLRYVPDFQHLPPDEKLEAISKRAKTDPFFRGLSKGGRGKIIEDLLGLGTAPQGDTASPQTPPAPAAAPPPTAPAPDAAPAPPPPEEGILSTIGRALGFDNPVAQAATQAATSQGADDVADVLTQPGAVQDATRTLPAPVQALAQGGIQGAQEVGTDTLNQIFQGLQGGLGLGMTTQFGGPDQPFSQTTPLQFKPTQFETPGDYQLLQDAVRIGTKLFLGNRTVLPAASRALVGATTPGTVGNIPPGVQPAVAALFRNPRLLAQIEQAETQQPLTPDLIMNALRGLGGAGGRYLGQGLTPDSPWGPLLGELLGTMGPDGARGFLGLVAQRYLPSRAVPRTIRDIAQSEPRAREFMALAQDLERLSPTIRFTAAEATQAPALLAALQRFAQEDPQGFGLALAKMQDQTRQTLQGLLADQMGTATQAETALPAAVRAAQDPVRAARHAAVEAEKGVQGAKATQERLTDEGTQLVAGGERGVQTAGSYATQLEADAAREAAGGLQTAQEAETLATRSGQARVGAERDTVSRTNEEVRQQREATRQQSEAELHAAQAAEQDLVQQHMALQEQTDRALRLAQQRFNAEVERVAPELAGTRPEALNLSQRFTQAARKLRETIQGLYQGMQREYERIYDPLLNTLHPETGQPITSSASLVQQDLNYVKQTLALQIEGHYAPTTFTRDVDAMIAQRSIQQGLRESTDVLTDEIIAETTLTLRQLFDIRSKALAAERQTTIPERKLALRQMADHLSEQLEVATDHAGVPDVARKIKVVNSLYARDIAPFTQDIGAVMLAQRQGTRFLPIGTRVEGDFDVPLGRVLGEMLTPVPPGSAARGADPLEGFRQLLDHFGHSDAITQAVRTALATDFYANTINPTTRQLDPALAQKWLDSHQPYLDLLPSLKVQFTGTQQQVNILREMEASSTTLLEQSQQAVSEAQAATTATRQTAAQRSRDVRAAGAERQAQARAALKAARQEADLKRSQAADLVHEAQTKGDAAMTEAKIQAAELRRQADETLARHKDRQQELQAQGRALVQTAEHQATVAKQAVTEALETYQRTFGASDLAHHAAEIETAGRIIGTAPEDLMDQIVAMPPLRRQHAVQNLLTQEGQTLEGQRGILRAYWDAWERGLKAGTGTDVARTLGDDIPLFDPAKVRQFLKENPRLFQTLEALDPAFAGHAQRLTQLTRGLELLASGRGGDTASIPRVFRGLSSTERVAVTVVGGLAVDLPIELLNAFVVPLPGALRATMATAGFHLAHRLWSNTSSAARVNLFREAMFDPDKARLLTAVGDPQTNPTWLRTALWGLMLRTDGGAPPPP